MKIEIDRASLATGTLLMASIVLLCGQTLATLRPQPGAVDRVMTLVLPASHPSANDPDSDSKTQDASPQANTGVCQGKAPDCEDDNGDGSDDDDSFDPPDPADPVPA